MNIFFAFLIVAGIWTVMAILECWFDGSIRLRDIFKREQKEENEENMHKCEVCGEPTEELIDTEGMINGGIGMVCEQCREDGDIGG